jgi:hypothetical protein
MAAHDADARARQAVALLVICTVIQRWDVLEACYTNHGILPVAAWRAQVNNDALHRLLVVHAWSGTLAWQRGLALLQVLLALGLALNRRPRRCALLSLWLYASATARHAKLAFILDRYAHILLLWLCAAPDALAKPTRARTALYILRWGQLLWIYWDAGRAKIRDPLHGWSFEGNALDAYLRHTFVGETTRSLLGDRGVRYATIVVPYVEAFAPVVACAAFYLEWHRLRRVASATIVLLHAGIGLSMNGAGLLSAFACAAWLFVEPPLPAKEQKRASYRDWCGVVVIVLFSFGSIAHGVLDMASCRDATQEPLKAVFHNRWNVFAGAEDHVTWEIMPARTRSGEIVDLWSQPVWKSTSVSGAPDNSSLSHLAAMARLSWLGRAARNRHRHAIEQASRRWRGGRRGDSARTRRKILISTQVATTGKLEATGKSC